MSYGIALIRQVLAEANHPSNEGNGYTVRIRTHSGAYIEGAVVRFTDYLHQSAPPPELVLQLGEPAQPTERQLHLDPSRIESVEILW